MEKVRPWCGQPSDRGRLRNRTALHAVHGRQLDLLSKHQWIRNGTGVMVRKLPYLFKRLVNVYNVRLNVHKIKR